MKYLIFGLIVGGFIGQNIAYTVAQYNPRIVEVTVAGECEQPEQVLNMQRLMESMKLPINNGMEQQKHEIDLIAQLIEEDLK